MAAFPFYLILAYLMCRCYVAFLFFVIGTDHGAAVVNLETGMHSWVLRSKSDVLAQQLLLSVLLCALKSLGFC